MVILSDRCSSFVKIKKHHLKGDAFSVAREVARAFASLIVHTLTDTKAKARTSRTFTFGSGADLHLSLRSLGTRIQTKEKTPPGGAAFSFGSPLAIDLRTYFVENRVLVPVV